MGLKGHSLISNLKIMQEQKKPCFTMLLFLACIIGHFLKLDSKARHRLSASVRLSWVAITSACPTIVGLPVFINLYLCPSCWQQQVQKCLYTSPYITYHYTIGVGATIDVPLLSCPGALMEQSSKPGYVYSVINEVTIDITKLNINAI